MVGHKVSKATVARVSTIIRQINKVRKDEVQRADKESIRLPLYLNEYDYLVGRIRRNWDRKLPEYYDKHLRYEYSTSWNEFSIRMSSEPLHAIFWDHLKDLIKEKIRHMADGKEGYKTTGQDLRDAAANIEGYGDAAVEFDDVKDRKGPDASFYYDSCTSENGEDQAPFVIEVNWANLSSKKLAKKAEEYIQLSNGKVRTVLNVDMNQNFSRSHLYKSC